jgi:hypothetical protein
MSKGRERAQKPKWGRDAALKPLPILVNGRAIPIVLLTDGRHMYEAEDYAGLFGFNMAEGRIVDGSRGASWRNGPDWFPVSEEEWRTRVIIISCPMFMLDADQGYWDRFLAKAAGLAGRPYRASHQGSMASSMASDVIFDVEEDFPIKAPTSHRRVDDKLRCACGVYSDMVNDRGDRACSEWPGCVTD